jgi:hypothetical protein
VIPKLLKEVGEEERAVDDKIDPLVVSMLNVWIF